MLPFGSQFIGQPAANLLFVTTTAAPPSASISAPSAAISAPTIIFAPQLTKGQPPPQPMLIAPNILKEISLETMRDASSEWTQHMSDDGRTYYYNKATKVSSWTKPDELKTQEEKEKSIWKEYKTPEGKLYYYNTKTKVTTWSKPDALDKVSKKAESSESKPELIHVSSNSEIEKAMEATLKTLTGVKKSEEKAKEHNPKESLIVEKEEEDSEYNLKKRQVDKFRELLQDKCNDKRINTNMNWEQASKYIQTDPRYRILGKVSEKKQVFNAWKIQRYKEERDERRLAIKMAKEGLENWLLAHPKMKPTLRYHKAEEVFATEHQWRAVTEPERREIFEDAKIAVAKRDTEHKKTLKERNIKVKNGALSDILDGIDQIDHRTTWAEAQRILIENSDFAKDVVLQGMDKEDALIVFQKHIKASEEQYVKDKQVEAKRIKRQERKTRETFTLLLRELHEREILVPAVNWAQLYPMISTDQRFENMLLTNGSTALDLFKFYQEDLKSKYNEDRKAMKEILEGKGVSFDDSTSFDCFQQWISEDPRFKQLDTVNLKIVYNDFYDKMVEKLKEAAKVEQKKQKRTELMFWDLLRSLSPPVEPNSEWEEVRERLKGTKLFEDEEMKRHCFDSYIKSLQEACGHYHSTNASSSKKKKKDKKRKQEEDLSADGEDVAKPKKKRKKDAKSKEEEPEKKKKKKRSKKRSRSESVSDFE